jgi:predicted membrane chloride channel (bestrophin family)
VGHRRNRREAFATARVLIMASPLTSSGLRAGPAASSPRLARRAGGSTASASGRRTFRERITVRTCAGRPKSRFEVFDGRSRDDDAVLDADALPATCALPLNIDTSGDVPYSEASRRYRRTVFTNEDWLQHRSSTRLFGNLSGTFTSGVVRSLVTEVAAVATISAVACVWNGAIQGFEDFRDILQAPLLPDVHEAFLARLPSLPFTLASPALGLLLVFRTNASYARWVESRVAWGRVVSHCRNVMRQSALWMNADVDAAAKTEATHRVRCAAWAFARCLASRLSGPEDEGALCVALETRLELAAAARLLRAPNRPLQALADLSVAMNALPIDEKRRVEMDKSVILLGDALETCERIFTSPVPLVYTRHTARFLSCWLLLLPLALWEPFATSWNHLAMVPAATLVAIFFFGIEELAVQLEEPFSIMPLGKLCDSVWDGGVELFRDPEPVGSSRITEADAVERMRSGTRS